MLYVYGTFHCFSYSEYTALGVVSFFHMVRQLITDFNHRWVRYAVYFLQKVGNFFMLNLGIL